MDVKYIFIWLCVVVVISSQGNNSDCKALPGPNCPNITLSAGTLCYSKDGNTWTATVNCTGNITTSNCNVNGDGWDGWNPAPNRCTSTTTDTPDNGTNDNTTTGTTGDGLTTWSDNDTVTTPVTSPEKTTTIPTDITSSEQHTVSILLPKQSGDTVGVYVGVTVTVVVIAVVVIVLLIWWRRRSKAEKHNDTGFHNDAYRQQDGTHTTNTGIPMSELNSDANDNQYSEIPAFNPTNETDNEYNTIRTYNTIEIPDNDGHDNYNHVNTSGAISNNYSHMPEFNGVNFADNTYSHIGNSGNSAQAKLKPKTKATNDVNDTYNTLQTSYIPKHSKSRKADTKLIENDPEYNHLGTDLKRENDKAELNTDTYSHISDARTKDGGYKDNHGKTVDASKSNNQFDASVVNNNVDKRLPNNGYEQVDGRTPYYMEFKVEDQADGDTNSGRPEQSFKVIEHTDEHNVEQEDESTANHHYFILEKQSNA